MINDILIDNGRSAAVPNSGCVVFNRVNGKFELATLQNYSTQGDFTGISLAQQIGITLRFWQGDWFLDATYGIPANTQIGQTLEPYFVAAISTAVLKIAAVTRVMEVNVLQTVPVLRLSLTIEVNGNQIITTEVGF